MPKSPKYHHVIIGNSAAAIGAVEAIRKSGNQEPILLISDEPYAAYSRPLISELLAGLVTKDRMYYRPEDFYARHQVETMLGSRVKQIDTNKQTVILEGGKKIPYHQLLIATGSSPIQPPIKGADLPGIFTFMRWQEAEALLEAAPRARKALVIGGGLIGLKAAEALHHIGLEVTVVDLADRLLPAAADRTAADLIEKHLRAKGLRIITSTTVKAITGDKGGVKGAKLSSGETLACDLVIIAVGVKPNTQIVEGSAIKANRGILVDRQMRTNLPNIYAAGDVAEGYDLVMGENRLLPLWPVAYRQGAIAGSNMAGVEKTYEGLFAMNAMELFGLPLISMGRLEAPAENGFEELLRSDDLGYRKIILQDDKIVGAIFLKAIDRAGIIAGLIKEQLPVGAFKHDLMADDFGLLSLPKAWRKEKLAKAAGGA
jgi:NAD(P)H-nitrite reductase large subunit